MTIHMLRTQHIEQNNDEDNNDKEELLQEDTIGHEDTENIEERITIDDINIIKEMNTSQLAIQKKSRNTENEATGHSYNLRKRPTKHMERKSLMVADETTGEGTERQYTTIHLRIHAHVMLTQMNVREGLLTFG